jgi:hypothetical protein
VYLTPANSLRDDCLGLNSIEVAKMQLLKEYKNYADVFLEKNTLKLPDSTRVEHAIPIEEGKKVLFSSIYSLSANKLQVLREYLKSSLAKEWIRHSESSAGAPILFVLKKNGGL